MRGNKNKMIHNGNTLNDYLIENDRYIGDLVNLFSVGTVLDKVNGDTFPMLVGGAIGFDEPMNIMEMEINENRFKVKEGDIIFIEDGDFHRVHNTSNKKLESSLGKLE